MRAYTKSQCDRLTQVLTDEGPARTDVEPLADGTMFIALYRHGEIRRGPYAMRRYDRRGFPMREAKRTATGWTEFSGPASVKPPARGLDAEVRRFVTEGQTTL